MDNYKIEKANELYTKLQGAYWAKEKCEEYQQYGQCENIALQVKQWLNELKKLNLTIEEKKLTGYEFVNNDLAIKWRYRMRG